MGYYTNFDFSGNKDDIIKAIEEISTYGESSNGQYDDIKWYSWSEHLKTVSELFPDDLIIIEGEGEESGDIWRAFFLNGKFCIQHVEMVYPDFDESMLK